MFIFSTTISYGVQVTTNVTDNYKYYDLEQQSSMSNMFKYVLRVIVRIPHIFMMEGVHIKHNYCRFSLFLKDPLFSYNSKHKCLTFFRGVCDVSKNHISHTLFFTSKRRKTALLFTTESRRLSHAFEPEIKDISS